MGWKRVAALLAAALLAGLLVGCGGPEDDPAGEKDEESVDSTEMSSQENEVGEEEKMAQYKKIKVDTEKTYQTMESFGTSGAWWSQYVGGFTKEVDDSGRSSREAIAELLFDKEKGIGLTCYRFNLGAGSADSKKGKFSDVHRRAQSFETAPGEYDFSKDANAVWFLKKAVELGVEA